MVAAEGQRDVPEEEPRRERFDALRSVPEIVPGGACPREPDWTRKQTMDHHLHVVSLDWQHLCLAVSLPYPSQVEVYRQPRGERLARTRERNKVTRVSLDNLAPDTAYTLDVRWEGGSRPLVCRNPSSSPAATSGWKPTTTVSTTGLNLSGAPCWTRARAANAKPRQKRLTNPNGSPPTAWERTYSSRISSGLQH